MLFMKNWNFELTTGHKRNMLFYETRSNKNWNFELYSLSLKIRVSRFKIAAIDSHRLIFYIMGKDY